MTMAGQPRKRPAKPKTARPPSNKKHQDELLDEALEATFPASDPVAMLEPAPAAPKADKDSDKRHRPRGEAGS